MRRASQEGHWIGNHTFSHRTPLGELDGETAVREVERTEQIISHLVPSTRLFRPYARAGRSGRHLLHPAVIETLQSGKYTCVLWNCVPGDWRDPDGWQEHASGALPVPPLELDRPPRPTQPQQWPTWTVSCAKCVTRESNSGQDFPPDCVPIVEGNIVHPLDRYTAEIPQ